MGTQRKCPQVAFMEEQVREGFLKGGDAEMTLDGLLGERVKEGHSRKR